MHFFMISILIFLVSCSGESETVYSSDAEPLPNVADVQTEPSTTVTEADSTSSPNNPPTEEYELCDDFLISSVPPMNIRDGIGPFSFATHWTYQFETIHTSAYLQWQADLPDTIAIWADEVVYNFSFVAVHHNAICCAYVGETLLTIDELHPQDVVLLDIAFEHYLYPRAGIIFTDAMGVRHHMYIIQSMEGGCAPAYYLSPTSNLIDHRADWFDLGIMSLPSTFAWPNEVIIIPNCPYVPSLDAATKPHMSAGYNAGGLIELTVEDSIVSSDFLFDDGHIGLILEFDDNISWVRNDRMVMSFWHGGYREFFEIHEDLYLTIAATLTSHD